MAEEEERAALQRPTMVATTLGISTAMLRRYARAYEEVYGKLPRDRREGRLYTKENVERLKNARALVLQKRAPSMEVALRHLSEGGKGQVVSPPPLADSSSPNALLVEELRWLRQVVEEQNRRLAMMESRMMTLLPPGVTETPAHVSSQSKAPTSERANEDVEQKSRPLGIEREANVDELVTTKPRWKQIGFATILAGAVPTTIAFLGLLVSFSYFSYDINDPPLRTVYLVFSFLVHLLPLLLGTWTGLAWPGRHLVGYAVLGVLAGALERLVSQLVIALSSGLVVRGPEDLLGVTATIVLFLAGGAIGDSMEKRRAVRGQSSKVSADDTRLNPRTVVFLQYVLPPILTFLGIATQAVVTLLQA